MKCLFKNGKITDPNTNESFYKIEVSINILLLDADINQKKKITTIKPYSDDIN